MEIRITIAATYSNGLDKDIKWYQWELFDNKGRPIAKSSPGHDSYFSQKRSAIAAAKRMKNLLCPNCLECVLNNCKNICFRIYDVTDRNKKVLIK